MNENLSNLFNQFNINPDSISPDMLNNLSSIFNNSSNNNENISNSNENDNNNNNNAFGEDSSNNIDFDTILKMKEIFDKMNSSTNDPRSNLLRALKPYLGDDKKGKVDQYIQFIKMSKVLGGFNFMGGENNSDKKS